MPCCLAGTANSPDQDLKCHQDLISPGLQPVPIRKLIVPHTNHCHSLPVYSNIPSSHIGIAASCDVWPLLVIPEP